MVPPANKSEPQPRSYHQRSGQPRKRRRLPSSHSSPVSPQKRPRVPLGDLDDTAANEVRRVAQHTGKSACKEFEDAIQPLAGVPAWLLEDCLKPTEGVDVTIEDGADQQPVDLDGQRVRLENFDIGGEDIHKGGGTLASVDTIGHAPVAGDMIPSVSWPGIDDGGVQEDSASVSVTAKSREDLQTRLLDLPAHTLRSIIYDIAVTDKTGEFEARLAEADADQDVPSAIFGYQYCSAESTVTMLDPDTDHDDVEDARHMIEELLLDIAGETSTNSPYSTKRAALVAILRVFDIVFGFRKEGNRIARDMPSDVEMNWASLFGEVFWTLNTFEKQRLTTARDGVFLEKLDSIVSSIAMAGLGCAGRKEGVLVELTKALARLSQHGESARKVEELERAIRMGEMV